MTDVSRKRVYAHVKQDRFILDNAEVATNWSGSTDVTDIALSANHREGTNSISFDKDGTTQAYGQITRTLAAGETINLAEYLDGVLGFWINLSSLTDIANVQLIIGESASHNYIYQTADTALTTGWNKVEVDINSPSSTTGNGAAWSSINYIALKVNFDGAANTLTAILLDTIYVKYSITSKTEITGITGSGLATAANQSTQITAEQAIQTSVQIMDDWDESDRAKVNPIVGQAGVQGGSGAVSVNTQRVVLATDVGLPAGTNTIGKLAANSGVDIGSVGLTRVVPESGTDATGADTYATVLTPSTTFSRIMMINEGSNPAVVSIDNGVTDTFKRIPGGSVIVHDGVAITTANIQAKNASAGNNYTNLTITVS